jgi:hypothetical protein
MFEKPIQLVYFRISGPLEILPTVVTAIRAPFPSVMSRDYHRIRTRRYHRQPRC